MGVLRVTALYVAGDLLPSYADAQLVRDAVGADLQDVNALASRPAEAETRALLG